MPFPETAPTEFDYIYLMDALKGLAQPRDRVTALLRKGQILRVKKGLYVKNDRSDPFSREIHPGPSTALLSVPRSAGYHA
jgi:hypothetical protein